MSGGSRGPVSMARRFRKKAQGSTEMSLQITSMADIFTIILVFLLKSYASGAVGVSPTAAMTLPNGKSGDQAPQVVKVEISPDSVYVEGERIASIKELEQGPSAAVERAFATARSKQAPRKPASEAEASGSDSAKPESRLAVMADKDVPYDTLQAVLSSAAKQGYIDYMLVIAKSDGS